MPSETLLSETLTSRLELYKTRRQAQVQLWNIPKDVKENVTQAIGLEVEAVKAAWLGLDGSPLDPVARLGFELSFWKDFYMQDSSQEEESSPEVQTLEDLWKEQCLNCFDRVQEALEAAKFGEAFSLIAELSKNPDLYGPVPDSLELSGPLWLDLPPDLLPPGHTFFDEPSDFDEPSGAGTK
jgi:hypothetical protein